MIKSGSLHNKSALLEAAYDEYCRNQDSSQRVDVEQFLTRYSTIRSSLRRQIEVHDFLADRTHLVDLCLESQWPEIGTKVFDFTILEELGRGAFARVYLCRQSGVGQRQVVVKFAVEGAYEADTLGRLSHPNIMPVHSVQFDELDHLSAICMPFRGRSTLCDLVDRSFSGAAIPSRAEAILSVARQDIGPDDRLDDGGPPDPFLDRSTYVDGIVHLGVQLADAIAHAHRRGIRHNDLKPSNVLLSAAGRPMLLDFNLANSDVTGSQTPGGTMPYMSPEQLAEFRFLEAVEPAAVDERSDVFSLGVILFELLSGRLPFGEVVSGRSSAERAKAMAAAQARGPQSLRGLNPQVDPGLARLIERCLSLDPSLRPRSASALAAALRRQLSWVGRSRRWTSRHFYLACSAVLIVVLLSGSAAGYLALRDPYSVRQYNLALADLGAARFDAAVARLNPVLAESPQDADALYLRGLARMKLKEYQLAIADLEASRKIRPSVRIQAAQAYCLCRLQYYREARFLYTKAMEGGYGEVDAKNNLAYCYILQRKFTQAMKLLDSAALIGPQYPQVFLNRATVGLLGNMPDAKTRWEIAIADSKRMLELSPANAHIELLAARIYALASTHNAENLELGFQHFEAACRRGLPEDKTAVAESIPLKTLRTSPRFQMALEAAPPNNSDPLPDAIIEPDMAFLTSPGR